MDDILVTVVIPTYGRTDYVKEAIESVINQTYKNIEIIVCDDNASNIDTRNKIIEIVSQYPSIQLILNNTNLGGALNRNEGIKASKGELVSFLDDDDVYLPTRIEKVVNLYKKHINERIGIIYTYAYYTDDKLNVTGMKKTQPTDNPLYKHMLNCLAPTSQWTIPRSVFDEVGMFEQTPCKQDSILLLKILGADFSALCVPEGLSYFRMRLTGRISSNYEIHLVGERNYALFLEKYFHKLTQNQINSVKAGIHKRMLKTYSGLGRKWDAGKEFFKIVELKHLQTRDFIYLFVSPVFFSKLKIKYRKLMKKSLS